MIEGALVCLAGIVVVVILGVIVYFTYRSPIPDGFKRVVYGIAITGVVVVIVCLVAYLMRAAGLLPLHDPGFPRLTNQ